MEAKSQPLKVIYSPAANAEIEEIWQWNVDNNGVEQADAYVEFLQRNIDALSTDHGQGTILVKRRNLRYILMKWSPGGFGHVAVYQVDKQAETVEIAHVFHTRQNWRSTVRKEGRKR